MLTVCVVLVECADDEDADEDDDDNDHHDNDYHNHDDYDDNNDEGSAELPMTMMSAMTKAEGGREGHGPECVSHVAARSQRGGDGGDTATQWECGHCHWEADGATGSKKCRWW